MLDMIFIIGSGASLFNILRALINKLGRNRGKVDYDDGYKDALRDIATAVGIDPDELA